jgi:hypothetical protein
MFVVRSFTSVCLKVFVSNMNDTGSHPFHVMCNGELGRLGKSSCFNDFTGYLTRNLIIYAGLCTWYCSTELHIC